MRNPLQIALRTAGVVLLLLVTGVLVARFSFNQYLHGEGFRLKISAIASRALKAEGEFQPLRIAGATVYTDGFAAQGSEAAFFTSLRAEQARADFNWHGLLHRAWQMDQIAVGRLDVRLADRPPQPVLPDRNDPAEPAIPKPAADAWKLDLRRAEIAESHWTWGGERTPAGEARGVALSLTPSGEAWLVEAAGGQIAQSGWPTAHLEKARLRYQAPSLYLTESKLLVGGGSLALAGEWSPEHGADLRESLAGVDLAPFLTPDWRARLTGQISGDFAIRSPAGDASGATVSGTARFTDAELTALPVLDQIALFTQTQRFRRLVFSKASLEFARDATHFEARHLVAESEGLLRVEGDFTVTGEQLSGRFQIGVTATSLQWLPGSRERVFTAERDGYLWAPLQLGGTVHQPTEDLSARLAHAAAGELAHKVESTVHEATKAVQDTAHDLLNRLLK